MKRLSKATKIALAVLIVAVLICCIFFLSKCGNGQADANQDSSENTQQTDEITNVVDLANAMEITDLTIEKDADEDTGLQGVLINVFLNVPAFETNFSGHEVSISVVGPDAFGTAFYLDGSETFPSAVDVVAGDGSYTTSVGFGEYALDVTEAIQDEIVADTESFKVRIYADGELVRELSYNDIMK